MTQPTTLIETSDKVFNLKRDIKTNTNLIPGSIQYGVQFNKNSVLSITIVPGEFIDDKIINKDNFIYSLPCKRDNKKVICDIEKCNFWYYKKSINFFKNNIEKKIPVTVIIKLKNKYRIKGLYNVSNLQKIKGKDGFEIYTINLSR